MMAAMSKRNNSLTLTTSNKLRPWYFPDRGGIRIRPLKMSSGSVAFRVEVPERIAGRRTLKQFKTTDEAESYASVMLVQRKNNGLAGFALTEDQRNIARNAFDQLSGANFPAPTLTTAVDFFLKHHRPEGGDISVDRLVDAFLKAKQKDKLRPRSLADLECRLGMFNKTFGERLVKDISAAELSEWVDDPAVTDMTRRNRYVILRGLLDYAVAKKHLGSNTLATIQKPKVESASPQILTVQQARGLLNAALENPSLELGWFVVLGLFLGVRTEELLRLKVADVRRDESYLHIGPHIAKKRRIRNVPFTVEVNAGGKTKRLDPVSAWLTRFPSPQDGMVAPPGCLHKFYKKLVPLAMISDWPANGMRHSFASYFYALTSNAAETCARLGHRREDVLFDHYRSLTKREEAIAYFSSLPPKQERNVVSLPVAAVA